MTAPAATADWPTSTCDGCGAPIIWATTVRGEKMPVDAGPAPDGNVVLRMVGGRPHAEVVSNPARLFGKTARKSHFATCPKAGTFRRPRGRR